MLRTFKEMKKQADERIRTAKEEYDEDGRAIIDITVRDDSAFLSEFSVGEEVIINNSVAQFLEHSASSLAPKEQITLKIHSDCIDDKEKKIYKKAISEYYFDRYRANEKDISRNNIAVCLLMLVGLFVLFLMIIFDSLGMSGIALEIMDIVAWVFVWEATDLFFFAQLALKRQRNRFLALINAKVEYCSLDKI